MAGADECPAGELISSFKSFSDRESEFVTPTLAPPVIHFDCAAPGAAAMVSSLFLARYF
jgi:hypothetical protein